MIEFKNIYKKFGQNEVLKDLNLSINGAGIFAILGPNGSGKTTLIKSLLGMTIPDRGEISLMGNEINKQFSYRDQIQYLPQIANFPSNLSVRELLRMIKDIRGGEVNDKELIDQFGLEKFMSKKLSTLSGGTKQKVNILLTFMFDRPLIILDEPTTGLDPAALLYLKELLNREREKGKTILITTHIMQFVEDMADQIVYLLEGKIYFQGELGELINKTGEKDFEHAIASIAQIKSDA